MASLGCTVRTYQYLLETELSSPDTVRLPEGLLLSSGLVLCLSRAGRVREASAMCSVQVCRQCSSELCITTTTTITIKYLVWPSGLEIIVMVWELF